MDRAIFAQRPMRAGLVVVGRIFREDSTQVRGTDFMVEALGDGRLAFSLVSGRIELRPFSGQPRIVVEPGERVVVDQARKVLSRSSEGADALRRRWSELVP